MWTSLSQHCHYHCSHNTVLNFAATVLCSFSLLQRFAHRCVTAVEFLLCKVNYKSNFFKTNRIERVKWIRFVVLEKFMSEIYPKITFKSIWLIADHTELNKMIEIKKNELPFSCHFLSFLARMYTLFSRLFGRARVAAAVFWLGQETIREVN